MCYSQILIHFVFRVDIPLWSAGYSPDNKNAEKVTLCAFVWSWCSKQRDTLCLDTSFTHFETLRCTQHIWSVAVALAVQKGQFFCQGNILLANTVRGCHRVFCSLSTSHTVCHSLCYALSKGMKCVCACASRNNSPPYNEYKVKENDLKICGLLKELLHNLHIKRRTLRGSNISHELTPCR